jgi:hypothetical protein
MFILDPDLYFLRLPDPGVKKAPDPDPQHSEAVTISFFADIPYWNDLAPTLNVLNFSTIFNPVMPTEFNSGSSDPQ